MALCSHAPAGRTYIPGRHHRWTARSIVRLGRSGRGVARVFWAPNVFSREVLGGRIRISGEGAARRSESRRQGAVIDS